VPPKRSGSHEYRTKASIPVPSCSENWENRISKIGWLSTSMMHDLRNPLGTVVAAAEMLRDLDLPPTHVKRLAANVYRAAARMRELLADLANASLGNRSTVALCDVHDVISAASDAALPASERLTVCILNDVPSGVEIQMERFRVEAVFFNLIVNALEAMPHGGDIRIAAVKAHDCVLIEVEDNGPGIPVAIRDRLFEPFVTMGKDHGQGLGLALSRHTALDHGGDLWLEPAQGARFVVRLPLTQRETTRPGSPAVVDDPINSALFPALLS
jgi:two-component system sensor histidine kinase HydH